MYLVLFILHNKKTKMKKQTKILLAVLAVVVVAGIALSAGNSELFQGRMSRVSETSPASDKPNFKVDSVKLRGVDPLVFVSIGNTGACYEGVIRVQMTLTPSLTGNDKVVYMEGDNVSLGCGDGINFQTFTFIIDDDSFINSGGPEGGYEVLNLYVDPNNGVDESDEGDNKLSIDLISNPGIITIK